MTALQIASWIGLLVTLSLFVWLLAVLVRVRRLRMAYRRILRDPVARWIPAPGMTPSQRVRPPLDGKDWSALSREVNDQGVYVVDYDAEGQRGVGGRKVNPANVAVFGIRCAKRYLDGGNEADLALALRQFEFIEQTAHRADDGRTIVWRADYDLTYEYGAKAPWTGCYFQNFCMSALTWAYVLTGEDRYLQTALDAVGGFELPVDQGGVAWETPNGGLFFEEIAAVPLHHILNGHCVALLGLHRFFEFTGSERAKQVFDRGLAGTLEMLPRYDRNGYSLYSLSPHPPALRNHFHIANPSYHHKHVALLEALHEVTGEARLRKYAGRWRGKSGSAFDLAWTAAFVVFKDVMRTAKKTVGAFGS